MLKWADVRIWGLERGKQELSTDSLKIVRTETDPLMLREHLEC